MPALVPVPTRLLVYTVCLFSLLTTLTGCKEDTLISPTNYQSIRGRVLNVATQQPIAGALVTLSPSGRAVSTSSAGEFRIDSVTAGTYTLQAITTNFTSQTVSVPVSTEPVPLVTLLLSDTRLPNQPPTTPTLVSPTQNSVLTSTGTTLRWRSSDANGDTLTYDVRLYKAGNTTPVASYTSLRADSLVVSNLDYGTSYLWQVIARDRVSSTNGPIWSFSTPAFPTLNYVFSRLVNGQYQIFASNGNTDAVQLTRNGSNWRPVASPNRQQIAYISTASNNLQLFIMNADGSNQRQVTTVPINGLYATDLSFCWSPDGSQLLYPSNNLLYVIRTDGSGLRLVTQAAAGRLFAGCDWTGQGNEIVARTTGATVYDNELTVVRPDGSDSRSVYTQRNRRVGNPAYSVDGRQIVFSADASGFANEQGRQLDARLYLLTLSNNAIVDLSTPVSTTQTSGTPMSGPTQAAAKVSGTNDLDPQFSPSGSQIIFTNSVNTVNGERSVYAIDLNGTAVSNRRLLINSADMPFWRQQ